MPKRNPRKSQDNNNRDRNTKPVARNLMDDFDEAEQEARDAELIAPFAPYLAQLIELYLAYTISNYLTGKEVPRETLPLLSLLFANFLRQNNAPIISLEYNVEHEESREEEGENEDEDDESQDTQISEHDIMLSSLLSRKSSIMSRSTTSSLQLPDTDRDDDLPEASFSFEVGNRTYIGNSQGYTEVTSQDLQTPTQRPLQVTPNAPTRPIRTDDGTTPGANAILMLETPERSEGRVESLIPYAPPLGASRRHDEQESDSESLIGEDENGSLNASPIFAATGGQLFSNLRLDGLDTPDNEDRVFSSRFSQHNEDEEEAGDTNVGRKIFGDEDSDDDLPGSNHSHDPDSASL